MKVRAPLRWPPVATFAAFVLVLTPSVASAAVTVTTAPPSSFDKNSASVCGEWTSTQPGFTEFQYGLSTAYGTTVGLVATDPGATSGSPCVGLAGLTPATTYHYRFAFLLPDSGSSCPCVEYDGSDQTVTTQAGYAPQIVGPTEAISYSTNNGFSISTSIDAGGYPTTWSVDYGTSPSDLGSSTSPPQNVLYYPNSPVMVYADVPSSGTLQANRVYYWQIVATNTLGTTKSAVGSVTVGTLTSTLSVATAGTGSGSVASSPAGIDCGTACSYSFPTGTSVTLTTTPTPGSYFSGWSGGACTGMGACTIAVNQATSVTANFLLSYELLTVANAGTGFGSITSSPAGIDCGTNCGSSFWYGTSVTLTATPAANSAFAGWSGACSGTGTCTVSMTQTRSVTASFNRSETLSVTKSGKGSGKVSSSPAGISCGSTCSDVYAWGTQVALTAKAGKGSVFVGWSGACTVTGSTCLAFMDQTRSVGAKFAKRIICLVPKVKGKKLKRAQRALRKAHCRPGKIRHRYSPVKKGHVIKQKPRPQRHLGKGAKVKLVVSKGKKP